MTILQKLQLRQSEVRQSLNALLGLETRTEEQDTESYRVSRRPNSLNQATSACS